MSAARLELPHTPDAVLPEDAGDACLVARIWRPAEDGRPGGPVIGVLRDGKLIDITRRGLATMTALCETERPAATVRDLDGPVISPLDEVIARSASGRCDEGEPHLLAPFDLQAVKAAGVTFAKSLIERVIEEQADGDPDKAAALRITVTREIGDDLSAIKPGSPQAEALKRALKARGAWSQYLEVGIGPDPEIFTKCQPLSPVGYGADIGLLRISEWNNPEPEVVLAVSSKGVPIGATLGNDVNLRDLEGRSALLLSKAKDNNASASIGPFLRLFDERFDLDAVRGETVTLEVDGEDGFRLEGSSAMEEISRDPEELIAAACGAHHQYPDGFCLFLGTMFAPTEDRGEAGSGFTHHMGDRVLIASRRLGTLANRVSHCDACRPWTFGLSALMHNLAARDLL